MVWAARSALRAMKHAHVLSPDLLTKTRSSPFGPEGHHAKLVQKRKRRNGVCPSSSTPFFFGNKKKAYVDRQRTDAYV